MASYNIEEFYSTFQCWNTCIVLPPPCTNGRDQRRQGCVALFRTGFLVNPSAKQKSYSYAINQFSSFSNLWLFHCIG